MKFKLKALSPIKNSTICRVDIHSLILQFVFWYKSFAMFFNAAYFSTVKGWTKFFKSRIQFFPLNEKFNLLVLQWVEPNTKRVLTSQSVFCWIRLSNYLNFSTDKLFLTPFPPYIWEKCPINFVKEKISFYLN